jgi:hypothetical protein
MKKPAIAVFAASLFAVAFTLISDAQEKPKTDPELAADLKLLQGSWELHHGNEGKGRPNTRSVKTIEGNKETLRRYSVATGKQVHEHSVEFKLSKSGSVHVMTFFREGGSPEQGFSYVYKVDEENFWDIPGLLQAGEYRNYQDQPTIWHWKKVKDDAPTAKNE